MLGMGPQGATCLPGAERGEVEGGINDRLQTNLARGVLIDSGRTREGRYLEMTRRATPPPHEQTGAF
jgi:hypothetical protein